MRTSISIFVLLNILLAGCKPSVPAPLTGTSIPATPTSRPANTTMAPIIKTATSTPRPEITIALPPCYQKAQFGDPQDSDYILPFNVGVRSKVLQGYCRSYGTHREQLAYDFDLDFGQEIRAARSGWVMDYDEHFADDGTNTGDAECNYVLIKHEDGTVAFYAHLMQDSVPVEVDDWVEIGQVIAHSGLSGLPLFTRSLLHFGVYASYPPREGHGVAVNFRNADGALDDRNGLNNGSWVEALPWIP